MSTPALQELYQLFSTAAVSSSSSSHSSSSNYAPSLSRHQVLQYLRDTGDPNFLFLRILIEQTSAFHIQPQTQIQSQQDQEETLFHCLTGFRHVVLHDWDTFSVEFTRVARDFLFSFGFGFFHSIPNVRIGYPSFRRRNQDPLKNSTINSSHSPFSKLLITTCIHTCCTFWKKSWLVSQRTNIQSSGQEIKINDIQSPMEKNSQRSNQEQFLIHLMKHHPMVQLHSMTSAQDLFSTLEQILSYPIQKHSHTLLQQSSNINCISNSNIMKENDNDIEENYSRTIVSVLFLSNLLQEFSYSSKNHRSTTSTSSSSQTIQYNASLEFHQLVSVTFESPHEGGGLHFIFQNSFKTFEFLCSILLPVLSSSSSSTTEETNCASRMTTIDRDRNLDLFDRIVSLLNDLLSWDWDSRKANPSMDHKNDMNSSNLLWIRPPEHWRDSLIRPEFLQAIFHMYSNLRSLSSISSLFCQQQHQEELYSLIRHSLRQLLCLLSSMTGPIFLDKQIQFAFADYLIQGCVTILSKIMDEIECFLLQLHLSPSTQRDTSLLFHWQGEIMDMNILFLNLVANFKIQGLSKLSSFWNFLHGMASLANVIIKADLEECLLYQGDMDSIMEGLEWRSEATCLIFEAFSLLIEDNWLFQCYHHAKPFTQREQQDQQNDYEEACHVVSILSSALSPLYQTYITCRINMAKMEEYCVTVNATELEDDSEDIHAAHLQDEMICAVVLGRLNVTSSSECLLRLMQHCFPRIHDLFSLKSPHKQMTPDIAVLLEEARQLVLSAGYLLTDEVDGGETPLIPDAILSSWFASFACATTRDVVHEITNSILSLMESQALALVEDPHNPYLSPLLANTFLFYFQRWTPAYILSETPDGASTVGVVATLDPQAVINFLLRFSLHCNCYWSYENHVQENVTRLLQNLLRRGVSVKKLISNSVIFDRYVMLQSVTTSLSHHPAEREIVKARNSSLSSNLSWDMVQGYQRLPYVIRSRILTMIIVSCCDSNSEYAAYAIDKCLTTIRYTFASFMDDLQLKQTQVNEHISRELACLLLEFFDGLARSSDITNTDTIVAFMTDALNPLAQLMSYYSEDVFICEALLRIFRDYAEHFIAALNEDQSMLLFKASATILRCYSINHCSNRTIQVTSFDAVREDEERKYSDILCAIQLLIHLGTKDFIDVCTDVEGSDVSDFVFFGLQQILPLMTKGLLQYPSLSIHYFSFVGFMMDTYAEKVFTLPFDLFQSLLQTLLHGMSHVDPRIAKSSLSGITSFARELLNNKQYHMSLISDRSDIMDHCYYRMLEEVLFQPTIWDRLEAVGMAMLHLVAVDVSRFGSVVNSFCLKLYSREKQHRLQLAFETLFQSEVISKVSSRGMEGRMNRLRFKKDFEIFVKDVHSFSIVR